MSVYVECLCMGVYLYVFDCISVCETGCVLRVILCKCV